LRYLILGAGALGSVFGGLLQLAGHEVCFVGRGAHLEALRTQGLKLTGIWGEHGPLKVSAATAPAELTEPFDVILLCVKAYDTEQALRSAAACIGADTAVVTLQNGIGHTDCIARYATPERTVVGTTAHGATRLGQGHVRHAGTGETVIGGLHPAAQPAAERMQRLFTDAGIQTVIAADIRAALWGKLIVNAGINPLTAVFKIRNGGILDSPDLQTVMRTAVAEACAVAGRLGIRLPYPDPVAKVLDVCRATAGNISSMHQDILAGRRTEIDSINGAIVNHGRTLGVPTPVNSLLVGLVTAAGQCRTRAAQKGA